VLEPGQSWAARLDIKQSSQLGKASDDLKHPPIGTVPDGVRTAGCVKKLATVLSLITLLNRTAASEME
jgi:hypothetical protein